MSLTKVLTEAIADIEQNGFDSAERVEKWLELIQKEIERGQVPDKELIKQLKKSFGAKIPQAYKGVYVPAWQKSNIDQKLYAELDRRILASVSLIKLRKQEATSETLRRFIGWSTSIPLGGGVVDEKVALKQGIKKSIQQMPFIERRVAIDQGHKLVATIRDIAAVESGAIAAIWHSHYRQIDYDYRKDHKARDGKVYLIRNSWADEAGLVKPDENGYSDEITQPAFEIYCRCFWQYIFKLNRLPETMLTQRGRDELAKKRN